MPDFPAYSASRTSPREVPRHDQIPSPVMTTLCMAFDLSYKFTDFLYNFANG